MKKKYRIGFIVLLVIVVLPVVLYIGGKLFNPDEKYYQTAWGLDMPHLKQMYSIDDIGSFGEGREYAIYKLREEPTGLNAYLKKEPDNSFEQSVDALAVELQVTAKQLPDWKTAYEWARIEGDTEHPSGGGFKDDVLYIIYNPSTMQLILVRDIR